MAIIHFCIQAESYIIEVESHEAHVADQPVDGRAKEQEAGKPPGTMGGVAPGGDRDMPAARTLRKETGPCPDSPVPGGQDYTEDSVEEFSYEEDSDEWDDSSDSYEDEDESGESEFLRKLNDRDYTMVEN